jgi:hypothetical protein
LFNIIQYGDDKAMARKAITMSKIECVGEMVETTTKKKMQGELIEKDLSVCLLTTH